MPEEELKVLAWLYLQIGEVLSQLPASIGDLIERQDLPKWFLDGRPDDYNVYDMMRIANKKAKKILREK